MARVPYVPYGDVTPSTAGTPTISENAPAAAFGGGVAAAEQELGGQEQKAGSTLFSEAVQAQDFQNTNSAREANVGFLNDAGDLWTKYHTLEGQAAWDALPKYKQDISDTFQKYSSQLTSPAARNDFLGVARYTQSRMIIGAGDYAASQQKAGWIKTNEATVDAESQFGVINRNDPNLIYVGEQKALSAAEDTALHLNYAPGSDQSKTLIAKAMGRYYRPIIESQAATDPGLASITFGRVRDKMDAETQAFIDRSLKGVMERADVGGVAQQAMGAGPGAGPVSGRPPKDLGAAVQKAASAHPSANADTLYRTAQLENAPSDPNRVSPTGARGQFQFVGGTAAQYGLTNPEDLGQSADAAARLQIDNRAALKQSLGRDPTEAEVYLAHQQGADGAAKLIVHPDLPATVAAGNADAILKNGGTRDQTAGQFVAQWAQKFNSAQGLEGGAVPAMSPGAQTAAQAGGQPTVPPPAGVPPAVGIHQPGAYGLEAQMLENADRLAEQKRPGDPVFRQQVRDEVYKRIQQTNVIQAKYEHELEKAKQDAAEQALNDIVKAMRDPNSDPHVLRAAIWDNDALNVQQKNTMGAVTERYFAEIGKPDIDKYGPAYTKVYNQITAAADDPNRISDPNDVWKRAAPGGDLTLTGAETLTAVMAHVRKQPDQAQLYQADAGLKAYAKGVLSRESISDFPGVPSMKDPKGEAIYNAKFLPAWEKGYSDWVTRDNKNPWEYLTQENADKLANSIYPQAQRARDRLSATGETVPGEVERPNAPLPPAPEGANPFEWRSIMSAPPKSESGRTFTHNGWAKVLTQLLTGDPGHAVQDFDEQFGKYGYSGADLLEQMKRPGIPAGFENAVPGL